MSVVGVYLFLGILCVSVQSNEDDNRPYKNLYGRDEFNATISQAELIPGIINFLQLAAEYRDEEQPDVTPADGSVYDFLVIGAGSAGSAVASRLTEVKGVRLLLIEAGYHEGIHMDIPLLPLLAQLNTSTNWRYETEPSDKFCRGTVSGRCNMPRGKVMGGSSVLNYMVATRGSRRDYDRWAELGNDGWSYDNVLKCFKKMENMQIPEFAEDTKFHGTKGPVTINYPKFHSPLADAFLSGAEELGFRIGDYNAEDYAFSYPQTTTTNGIRMSSNRAYLHNRFRRNLDITMGSLVSKILIDPLRKQAYGVQYTKNGKEYTVYAKKEVILCAGAIGSPQILMLSGIGPADHLKELGIPVIKDAPVGHNLQDHFTHPGLVFTVDQPVSFLGSELTNPFNPYIKDYLLNQTGPYTTPGAVESLGFVDAFDMTNPNAEPNIEQIFYGVATTSDAQLLSLEGYNEEIVDAYAPIRSLHTFTILPILMRPKSRGWIKLRSSSIDDKPLIYPNFLDHPDDVRTLIAGIKSSIMIGQTAAMRKFNSTLFDAEFEECREIKDNFDQHMECQLRVMGSHVYHESGTCKMGPESDSTSVVNPRLQVIGIERLRVADASIMPEIPSVHLNIPTMMIGEKLADMVKQAWGYQDSEECAD